MRPQTRAGKRAKWYCDKASITLPMLGQPRTWDDKEGMKVVQSNLPDYEGRVDGLFYKNSTRAFCNKFQHHLILDHALVPPPVGMMLTNYLSDVVHHFPSRRSIDPSEIVVHESVTSTWEVCVRVLARRHLGVHFMVHRDGSVTQHADGFKRMAHAGRKHNAHSIAVEVINSYYGKRAKKGDTVIEARWAHKGSYIVPPEPQMVASAALVKHLTDHITAIPLVFVGERDNGKIKMGRLPKHERRPHPGIWAHGYFAHADGWYPVKRISELTCA